MKIYSLIAISLIVFLCGCDHTLPLRIDNNTSYEVKTACGKVTILAQVFSRHIFILQNFSEGKFVLNTDSLLVIASTSSKYLEDKYHISNKGKRIKNAEYIVDRPEEVNLTLVLNGGLIDEQLMILPCGYIKCNGESLIQDTIRISAIDASAQS